MIQGYSNKTSSGLLKTGAGTVTGVFVASSTAGTIKLWDNTSAAGTVLINTTAAITAPAMINFGAPIAFSTGLFLTIGGTADVTVFFN